MPLLDAPRSVRLHSLLTHGGINVNFKAIAVKGRKPFLASFLVSILLMLFAAGVAVLFF